MHNFTDHHPQHTDRPEHPSHTPHPTEAWGVAEGPCLECDSIDENGEDYQAMIIRESAEDGGLLIVACECCGWAGYQEGYGMIDPLNEYAVRGE